MPSRRMQYEVIVDARDGIRELKRLGEAGRDAGQDIEAGMEDAESAGKQAAKALVQAAQDIATELKSDKEAADALARALGPEMAAKVDTQKAVTELKSIGLTADQIKLDADALGLAIKDIDNIKLDTVDGEIKQVGDGLTTMRDHGDQSRSVLANMAGNAAQDLGQLGGVVGTLGVGIGQLAEYAVDGNIKMGQLAQVAGPMAALAAATLLVTKAMQAMNVKKAFDAAEVERFTEAIGQGESAVRTLFETVESTGKLEFTNFGLLSADIDNIIPNLQALGISFEDFSSLVDQGPEAMGAYADSLRVFAQDAEKAGDSTQADKYREAGDAIDEYAANVDAAATANEALQGWLKLTAPVADEMLQSFLDQENVFGRMVPQWDALAEAMRDTHITTDAETQLIEQLAEAFGITTDQVIAYGQQHLDEKLQAETEAIDAQVEAAAELAEAQGEVAEAVNAAGAEMDTAEGRAAAFGEALDRLNAPSELTQGLEVKGFVEDMTALTDAVAAMPDALFEPGVDLVPDSWDEVVNMPEELGTVQEALGGFRDSIQSEMQQSFASGGQPEVLEWAENTRKAITDQLIAAGLEVGPQIDQILSALGLLPDQVETQINFAVDEQQLAALEGIASGAGLEGERQIQFDIAIANNDPDTALEILNRQLAGINRQVIFFETDTGEVQVALEQIDPTVPVTTATDTSEVTSTLATVPGTAVPVTTQTDTTEAADALLDETSQIRRADIVARALTRRADEELDDVAAQARTAVIVADAATLVADSELDLLAAPPPSGSRTAVITVVPAGVESSRQLLDGVARPGGQARTADTNVVIHGGVEAEQRLDQIAEDRTADIYVVTHNSTTGGSGGGGNTAQPGIAPAVTGLAAVPTANGGGGGGDGGAVAMLAVPASTVKTINISVNAAVIGDRSAVRRTVMRAVRDAERLGART